MKPLLLIAHSKDLNAYLKNINELNQASLLEVQKKLIKMQLEVIEYLSNT